MRNKDEPIEPECYGSEEDLARHMDAKSCLVALSRLLIWIADAPNRSKAKGRAQAARWYLGHGTVTDLAKECGMTKQALSLHVVAFRREFPAIAAVNSRKKLS